MRLPTASPNAVRDPLELTGNPWVRPTPTFATPSARSSAFASISSPSPVAKARAVNTLSEKATIAIPTAGRISVTTSLAATRGRPATGQSAGIVPTTSIPLVCNDNATTPMVAARTAIKGPGNLGAQRPNTSNRSRTDAAKAAVGQ